MPSAVTDKQYGNRELLNIFHLNSFTQNGYISPTMYLPRMVTSNSVSGTQVPCLLPSAVTDKQYGDRELCNLFYNHSFMLNSLNQASALVSSPSTLLGKYYGDREELLNIFHILSIYAEWF